MAKVKYPQECFRHPKRKTNLVYVYVMQPDPWCGYLMCGACKDGYDKGHLSPVRED